MKKLHVLTSLLLTVLFFSCNEEEATALEASLPTTGVISGGPFYFCVDGVPDMVDGVAVTTQSNVGDLSTWVITDEEGNILGLPPTLDAVHGVNFDEAGAGVCLIWYLRYEDGLIGAEVGMNANDLSGTFDLSNSISVTRSKTEAGELVGGPFEFTVDGTPDMVSGISLNNPDASGTNRSYVITDADGNILGLPPTLAAVEGVNFDEAGAGVCLIWYLRYEDGLVGAEVGLNANDLEGCFDLSNPITVTRNGAATAGTLSANEEFVFCVDGTPDMVSGISLDSSAAVGDSSTWVITDDLGNILGLPPTLAAVEGVNFDAAGPGVCLIWYARYSGDISGAEVGSNANDITGNFALSNPITVTRNYTEAGELMGGPYTFTVDGNPDMVENISLYNPNGAGTNRTYLITAEDGTILGLPPTLDAVKGVDFDAAGEGVCFIWYVRYEDGLKGLEAGLNANDLEGCFDLSTSVKVTRNAASTSASAGTLIGDDLYFCVDGTPDYVSGITLDSSNASGSSSGWIVTEVNGNILGLPPTLEAVEGIDFDASGPDVCRIYYVRYNDIQGNQVGLNIADLSGDFALSNSIKVTRSLTEAGTISADTEFVFDVDGTPDYVSGITLSGTSSGSLRTWVVTDDLGNILGLPPTLAALEGVNFDAAGSGTCLIWYLRYEEGLQGLAPGQNANDLEGCFDLSNYIPVVRN